LSWRRAAIVCCLLAAVASCHTLRDDVRANPSTAFDRPEETSLGRAYAAAQAAHAGHSGFRLINNGVSALMTRAAMADLAERSIDIQYYIYDADPAGAFLLERLIVAADRGVRVRMLLDDQALGLDDATLKRVDAHPNIEIRLFNPFRDRSRWSRSLQLVLDLDRLGRRMHNKVFAVDGQMAVVGGRNISSRYFEADEESNFRDMDLLAVGPIVRELSEKYDEYWNSAMVVPVAALGVETAGPQTVAERLGELRRFGEARLGPHVEYGKRRDEFMRRLKGEGADLVWAPGRAVAEPPVRLKPGEARPSAEVARALALVRQAAKSEMAMEVAYFIPGDRGVEVLSELTRRGMKVRILTNSLASTDVIAVHSGYARYREALLAAGVDLHEYRIDASRPAPKQQLLRPYDSQSALHAKFVVYDRRMVWVGSANFDLRSRRINTEDGMLIESEALAGRVLAGMERDFTPEESWKLELETDAATGAKRIVWNGVEDGKPVRHTREPGAGFVRTLEMYLFSILPGLEEIL
jgi:putative cardiolipin synthase